MPSDNYVKYVICIKCKTLHLHQDSYRKFAGTLETKTCNNVMNPNHPKKHFRKPCGQPLMYSLETTSGKTVLTPFKVYCYKHIKQSLKQLVATKDFDRKCDEWRTRKTLPGVMTDIYDGNIWKNFKDQTQAPYFDKPRNYGLILNLDWFKVFKHSQYSVAAVYLIVANLPRSERYLRKNLILVGIIPHIKPEPPTNAFLKPLVEELQEAWDPGFALETFERSLHVYHFALICVACDVPACRKVCGFLGNNYMFITAHVHCLLERLKWPFTIFNSPTPC